MKTEDKLKDGCKRASYTQNNRVELKQLNESQLAEEEFEDHG